VFTDSIGKFVIPVPQDVPIELYVDQLGYAPDRFELGGDALSRVSVLLLQPQPIQLEAVNVVAESAVEELLQDLRSRRNAYFGPAVAMDRAWLERYEPLGTAWDFVRQRIPEVFECEEGASGLCVRGRGISFRDFTPTVGSLRTRSSSVGMIQEVPVTVCIDGWTSWGALSELANMDINSVSLIEIFGRGRGGIWIYTPGYLASSARMGRKIATPFGFGC
jgi:hypothetical protein